MKTRINFEKLNKYDELVNDFYESVITEIEQYPCLGLVSKENNGCHTDMDYNLFIKSSELFKQMFNDLKKKYEYIKNFEELRLFGYEYEKEMFKITGGINTQKGLIFCGLIFFFILVKSRPKNHKHFSKCIKKFCKPLKNKKHYQDNSKGNKLFQQSKVKGARHEAISGYKSVFKSYKYYFKHIHSLDIKQNYKYFLLLLNICKNISDTTLITKLNILKYSKVFKHFKVDAKSNDFENTVLKMNEYSINNKISPGGSADLFSLIIFLMKISI